ncbi:AcrR family transcriptional regulator [Saccharothrix coeruleofusca]|uniref:TetR/AcrR family transcriptional regulator C-terminal domain-containing protein n=1 Tax=Saccharothrix coeruleofusca TaxID=33919 RepID=UPI0027DC392E|nr:TetR/AcrR family transcriptional regulator C-terminal domain-containing protein [Saccharothrix coeruleofusca]MBP2338876.1 AcrR family transcriptional regulator [Saccharothrix coeruleofusca]
MSPIHQTVAPRRGRPRRDRQPLTRQRIVAEAMAVVEGAGLAGLTMRGLAKRLGVDTMSLYNHVDSRDALLDAITGAVFADLRLPPATGGLRADVRAAAHAFRDTALRHPRCAHLALTRRPDSPTGPGPVAAALGILRRAGFPPATAVRVLRTGLAYLVGALLRELSAIPASDDAARRAEFDFGLDLLITAITDADRDTGRG